MKTKYVILWLFFLSTAGVLMAEPKPVIGDYIEARSSHVYTCGCLYSGEEVTSGREAILGWHIQEGTWQGVQLNNLSLVAVLISEENLGINQDIPRQSILYLDADANEQEKSALLALITHHFFSILGDVYSVHTAPIIWEADSEAPWVMIPGKVEVSVRAAQPEDAHLGSHKWYDPFIPLTQETLATTKYYSYQDNDLDINWWDFEPRIAGYFGTFVLPKESL